MDQEKIEGIKIKNAQNELQSIHYYGDTIRNIYIIMAVIILLIAPFFKERIPVTEYSSIFVVMLLSIFAGLTNPKSRIIIVFDFAISISSLLIFGYEALASYNKNLIDLFFASNLILSVISVFAIYYSSKTLRGNLMLENK